MKESVCRPISAAFVLLLASAAPATARAGDAENQLFSRLLFKELTFFGIDADVRRLLNDSDFEADVRKWYRAVNPVYIERAIKTGDIKDSRIAEMRQWIAATKLVETNASQVRVNQLVHGAIAPGLPSEKGQIYLAYFLRTGQVAKARALLEIYATEFALFAAEYAEDPRHQGRHEAAGMQGIAYQLGDRSKIFAYADCANRSTADVESLKAVGSCLQSQIRFVLPSDDYVGPQHVVSRTGFVGGNDIAYFTDSRHDRQIVGDFKRLYEGEKSPVADTIGGRSVAEFERLISRNSSPLDLIKMLKDPAISIVADTNPIFSKNSSGLNARTAIFPELIRGIRSAKHTIFVDIFFLGGTLGASMINELIAASERGVRVLVLHDTFNSFDYRNEIEPIFSTLMAYSNLHPEGVTAVGSYIMGHRTGLPRYIDAILPDSFVQSVMSATQAALHVTPPLFPKAKSDHSKVMVIDGAGLWADSTPTAYVGSKNWTDSSGGMTFDEVARVKGPAAVVVQDNYYWDMWFGLRSGSGGRKEMSTAQIEKTLELFDALGRRWDPVAGRVNVTRAQGLVHIGAQPNGLKVRSGENNVDGSILSAIDQNIYAIRSARAQVIVNDQFLYDRRIVDELIDKADSNPNVQVYILLEPLSKSSGLVAEVLGGFPNSLYLDQLLYKRTDLDDRGSPVLGAARPNVHFKWKHIPEFGEPEFHLEYHMKTISVDGFDRNGKRVAGAGPAVLISGSANKDNMTMTGAFRESQLELWDDRPCSATTCGAVAEADVIFWKRWDNRMTEDQGLGSVDAVPFKFVLPEEIQTVAKKALSREMSPSEFTVFMRSLIHTAYALESSCTVE